jgi:hypothetical protein
LGHSTASGEVVAGPLTRVVVVTAVSDPQMSIETPPQTSSTVEPFQISGWAIDRGATSATGVSTVHVWAFRTDATQMPMFVGQAQYGAARSDVAALYGAQFANSGFSIIASGLPPGNYDFYAFMFSTVTGTFNRFEVLHVSIVTPTPDPLMAIDALESGSVSQPFEIDGWAIDRGAGVGTGVNAVHVWAFRTDVSQAPIFIGQAQYGNARPEVGAMFGSQFTNSGFSIVSTSLPPGAYDLYVFMHSTVTATFNRVDILHVVVVTPAPDPEMTIEGPQNGASVSQPFAITGWAIDHGASMGTGVNAVHVWALRADAAQAPIFVGQAQYGDARPQVGAMFGSRFTNSGYSIVSSTLPAGIYDVYVFVHSTVSGTFNAVQAVHLIVQ